MQHCSSFSKGVGHCDLARDGHQWEVKICKDSGLTINQSKQIAGENYIVINYKADSKVTRIFVLWEAADAFFSPRKPNANARALVAAAAKSNIEVVYEFMAPKPSVKPLESGRLDFDGPSETASTVLAGARPRSMAKATLPSKRPRRTA